MTAKQRGREGKKSGTEKVRESRAYQHSPVELIDVLYVAEQCADLLWFKRQVSTVNDAPQIVLRETKAERKNALKP